MEITSEGIQGILSTETDINNTSVDIRFGGIDFRLASTE